MTQIPRFLLLLVTRLTRLAAVALLSTLPTRAEPQAREDALPPGAEAISLLGKPLVPPPLPPTTKERYEALWAAAKRAYDHAPDNPDSILWLGRRTAYLGRYREAVEIYTRGIAKHPEDSRLYRHRGHRYITLRRFDRAIADLERAAALVLDQPDAVEPDGIPNARGIPTSTLKSNIRYHLGLAYYLTGRFEKALGPYREDVTAAVNPDMLVATSHWLYMTLRRLGRDREAAEVLRPIGREMDIIENGSYHRLLLLYKGELPLDSLRVGPAGDDAALQDVTVSYGIGNWHLDNGRGEGARKVFARILGTTQWAAFGYIAAEAEVARLLLSPPAQDTVQQRPGLRGGPLAGR